MDSNHDFRVQSAASCHWTKREFLNCQRTGCRGAIRTPVPGFKVQGPATRRPGIKLSAVSLSCSARTTPPIHQGCGLTCVDLYGQYPPIRCDRHRARNTAPMRPDFKAFDFNRLCTHNLGSSEENRTPISALKEPHPGVRRRCLLSAHCRKCTIKTKSPRFVSEAQKNYALWIAPAT